jgi:hypothetical protein
MQENIIKVQIGEGEPVLLHIRETRAPKAYDGFGTFTLAEYHSYGRLIAIRDEHLTWQLGRYNSGIFACEPPEQFDARAVETEIWKRIAQ